MGKTARRLTAVILIALALFITWPVLQEFPAVDSCLDSGGRFDYEANECDYYDNHARRSSHN
jgi:hypothetical protein